MQKALLLAMTAAFGAAFATTVAAAPVELRLAHHLDDDKAAQLGQLVDRFNAENKGVHLTLTDYATGAATADLLLPDEDSEDRLVASKRFKPLWQVMKEAREPIQAFSQYPRMAMPLAVDAKGHLLALPIAMSTPIVYANRALLEQAGVDTNNLPRTWQGWQDALGKLVAQRDQCPFTTTRPEWVFIENTAAWNGQAMTKVDRKREELAANGLIQVKHLAMMESWNKSAYLKLFGHRDEAEDQFASGNCAVMAASSASYPELQRKAKFDILLAPLPYHEGAYGAPQNTLADGASLWVAAGRRPENYKAAAQFIRFMLTPQTQVAWQVGAGYLPLNGAGVIAAQESSLLKDSMAAQRIAIAQLTNKPVIPASAAALYMRRPGVRRVLNEEMDALWANTKPAKQALDDAVSRVRAADGGYQASLR